MNFKKDIILDDQAFDDAVREFNDLKEHLAKLRKDLEEMIEILEDGFNTPAGAKFINSVEANLFVPLDDQGKVINHIADSLNQAKTKYQSVFEEYEKLQKAIDNYITH